MGENGKKKFERMSMYVNVSMCIYNCIYTHVRMRFQAFPPMPLPGKGLEAAFGFVEASHIVLPECCKALKKSLVLGLHHLIKGHTQGL